MSSVFDNEGASFSVVVNDEEQYSIWPTGLDVPVGWHHIGPRNAPRAECLEFIKASWTDMRPRSVRGRSGLSQP